MALKQPSTEPEAPRTVEERLAGLESSVRRWRLLSMTLAGLMLLVLGVIGVDYLGLRGTIHAKRFVIRNEKGIALELEVSPQGDGLISINDGKGLPRVLLGNSQKGFGTIELYGGDEHKMVFLGGSGSGGQIAVYNNEKKKVVDLQATKTNSGAVVVNDFDGRYVHGLSGERR